MTFIAIQLSRHGSGDAASEILARHPSAGETSFRGTARALASG
jgi:hypothetical protein